MTKENSFSRSFGKVAVVGQGYVGLPLAVSAAGAGWRVFGIDVNEQLVGQLNRGESHIEDVESDRIKHLVKQGNYSVGSNFDVISNVRIVVLCVPTPVHPDYSPNLNFILEALKSIAPYLNNETLIINESTSFPGTLNGVIKKEIYEYCQSRDLELFFASAPERIDPNNTEWNLMNTPRVLAGCCPTATGLAKEFYSSFCTDLIVVSSPVVAETAKLLENTFRQVNIALINQLVPFCRSLGIDVREVIEAAASKPYGFMKFYPGAGVGGHCIPIDPLYLLWKSRQMGIDLPLVDSADKTNRAMPKYVVERLMELATLKPGDTALILGVAYKSGISDTRESPALDVAHHLISAGIETYWSDQLVSNFDAGGKWDLTAPVDAAIIVTSQHGQQVEYLANSGVPILDCTGAYKDIKGVFQL